MISPKKCPLCKSKYSKKHIVVSKKVYGDKKNKRAFYHCNNCDVRYQFPSLTPTEESKFYKNEFEKFMEKRVGKKMSWTNVNNHILNNQDTFKRRYQYIKKYLNTKKKILEIGCSSGFMLLPFKNKGYDCTGIEPSGFFNKFLKKKKIKVYPTLDDLKKKETKKFDLIWHFFVLEHVSDPINFLKDQISLLKKGGKIIFEIPNVADALHTKYIIKEFENFYWSIAHPWYFSKKSLKYVFKKVGKKSKIFLDQRYDLSNHFFWIKEGKPGGMGKFTKIIGQDLEKFYKKELIKSGNCDTLIGVISV